MSNQIYTHDNFRWQMSRIIPKIVIGNRNKVPMPLRMTSQDNEIYEIIGK